MTFKEYWRESEADINTTYSYAALYAIAMSAWSHAREQTANTCIEIIDRKYNETPDSPCMQCDGPMATCGECITHEIRERFELEQP